MLKTVVMPAAGQTTDVATVTELKVAVGDTVRKGDVLLEVETDKAVLPIESFARGVVVEIFVNESDTIDAGSPLLSIGDENDLKAAQEKQSPSPAAILRTNETTEPEEDDFTPILPPETIPQAPISTRSARVKAMPSAKQAAAQLGISLDELTPANGLFLKVSDVKRAAEEKQCEVSAPAEINVPLGRMRTSLARRLDASANIPAFTVGICADASAYRTLAEANADITPAHYVMLALSHLALRYPILRTRNDDMKLSESDLPCIGMAVYGENGTVASVLEDTALYSISAIAKRCGENRAAVLRGDFSSVRPASVVVHDMTQYAVNMFTAPVIAPSVAAFGITYANHQIAVHGSFDMRVVEGHIGASIMADLEKLLSTPVLMLM